MPLDPQCQEIVDTIAAAGGAPFEAGDYLAVRRAYASTTAVYRHDTSPLSAIEDSTFPGPAGDVPVRIYHPITTESDPLACLIFFHGGGWAVGDLDTHDHVCRFIAANSGCRVISVDYRLAPEHKFPAPLDDCVAAVNWVFESATTLKIDKNRVAIGGDSAGGNLAASTAIVLRDNDGPRIQLQLLIYPAVDFTADNESLRENAEGYLLTRTALNMFTDLYLPNHAARSDPRASPQLRANHQNLARAFIQTAEFDPLRDEGRAYAETLMAAGCPVEYKCYRGVVHGFARMGARVDRAFEALKDASGVLRETFGIEDPNAS